MNDFVRIIVDDSQLLGALRSLEIAGGDLTPAMRKIAGTLTNVVEENFEAEGRPRWKPSERAASEGGVTLQKSGRLAASISTGHDATSAQIGSNVEYAAIHQFGGKAGRGRKVDIPARPFLPITADGELQPETTGAVLDTILRHLQRAAGV